jgi:hypothetical protein
MKTAGQLEQELLLTFPPDFAEQAMCQATKVEIIFQDTSTDCVSGRAVRSPVRSEPSGAVSA